jgi:hypothetical protein
MRFIIIHRTSAHWEAGAVPSRELIVRVGAILRASSLDEAIAWAMGQAHTGVNAGEIRPVTEAWDIGAVARPDPLPSRRYMVARRGGAGADEAGRSRLAALLDEAGRAGSHVTTETVRTGGRGRHYRNSKDGVSFYDGPFAESKELIGGYMIVDVPSFDDADRWARRYVEAVGVQEVELLELEQ